MKLAREISQTKFVQDRNRKKKNMIILLRDIIKQPK